MKKSEDYIIDDFTRIDIATKDDITSYDTYKTDLFKIVCTLETCTFLALTPLVAQAEEQSAFTPEPQILTCQYSPVENQENTYNTQYECIRSRIIALGLLKDNWDFFGSEQVPSEIIATATKILDFFKGEVSFISSTYATPQGTICIDWKNFQDDIVSVDISDEDISYFTIINGEKTYNDEKAINEDELNTLKSYIKCL